MEARTQDHGGIGWMVKHLHHGHRMRRRGWSATNLWVVLVPRGAAQIPHKIGGGFDTLPFIAMKTADDQLVPWLASQTDLLSLDWELVDAPQPGHTTHVYSEIQKQV